MIKSLQSLRAIGAILIFIHHFGFSGAVVASFGDCAVNWFMTLSGFVLCAAYENRTPGSIMRFMINRFRRIAPLYYISLALMLLICRFNTGLTALGASVLMIQSWFPNSDIFFSLNSPAWFISDLMFCYLLFIPLLGVIKRRGAPLAWMLGLGTTAYVVVTLLVPSEWALFVVYIFPPMQLASFVVGMLLWQVIIRLRGLRLPPPIANTLIITIIALEALFIAAYGMVPPRLSLSCYWWVPTGLLLVALTLTDRVDCFATRLLHLRPMIALGNASLSFYMLHLPWIKLTRMLMTEFDVKIPMGVELTVSVLLLAAISCLIHRRFFRGRI